MRKTNRERTREFFSGLRGVFWIELAYLYEICPPYPYYIGHTKKPADVDVKPAQIMSKWWNG